MLRLRAVIDMRLIKSLFRKKGRSESLFHYLISLSHLWLGLLSSIVLFIVCLAGSLYAFRTPYQQFQNRQLLNAAVPKGESLLQVEEIESLFHDRGMVIESIVLPSGKKKNLIVSYRESESNLSSTGYFNPYTGEEVEGHYNRSSEPFFQMLLGLHKNLLLGTTGKQLVGISVIIFVILLLSGMILWWPKSRRWRTIKASLQVRWKANSLHRVMGVYAFLPLLFISLTGLYIAYPWMKNAVIITLGGEPILQQEDPANDQVSDAFAALMEEMIEKEAEKRDGLQRIRYSLSEIKAMGDSYLDYPATTTIVMADAENPRYRVSKINTHNLLGAKVTDAVTFDQKGEMRSLERFSDLSLHRQFIEISLPLHTGEIIGLPGILFYALTSLIGCSLPVTGFLIWWKKAGRSGR
jgi:uncharacterized iron-regulated membrane protein